MSSGPSTDDGNRKLLIEQCIEGGLIKEKESGEFSEAADPRSKFQKLMRISAREEMAMTENAQLSAYLPLRDYLKKYLFAKKRGGYQDPTSKQERRVMDEATLNQELFDTLGNRMSFPEIQAITRELAEIDGKRGHVSMDTLHNYLRFNPSKDGTKRHRDQMPSIIDSIRKRMSALHKKNQLSFNNLNKNSTFISDGELHKWVLQQPSLAYDLTFSELKAVLDAIGTAGGPSRQPDSGAFDAFVNDPDNELEDAEGGIVMQAPVIDVQVSVQSAEAYALEHQGYKQVMTLDPKTKESKRCNLNEGSLTAHKVTLWYLRKHNTPLMPIVDIIVESCSTKSSLAISGYTCLRKNLNRGTIGQPQYLWVRRATDADQARTEQLIEIQATIGKERVQDDPMYLAPDQVRGIANGPRGQRDHGSAFVRVDGNLNKGSMGTDVFLWFRPNMPRSTEVDQPARRYIKWSSDKRQAMCEEALKRAVRQQCSNSELGGPDVPSLFNKHDQHGRGKLTKPQFTKLLDEVGFNLESRERDLLFNRMDVHGTDSIHQEEFLSFVSLTDHQLDEVRDTLKQRIRTVNKISGQSASVKKTNLDTIKTKLKGLAPSPNISPRELAIMLTYIHVFPTPSELTRVVHFYDSESKGEVAQLDFYNFIAEDRPHEATHRRCATRVLRASEALRNFIIGAAKMSSSRGSRSRSTVGDKLANASASSANGGTAAADVNSGPAWDTLMRRSKHRRGNHGGMLSSGMLSGRGEDALDAADIAIAVERQLVFDDVPRLSQREYRQLMMLVAPEGKGRVPHDEFHSFAKTTVRPLADILRLMAKPTLLKKLLDDHKKFYDKGGRVLESNLKEELEATMRNLNFYQKNRFSPQTIKITTLRSEFCRASAKGRGGGSGGGGDDESQYDDEIRKVTLSEWVSLVLHTGADVIGESPDQDDEEDALLVHTRKLLEGICMIVNGDTRKMEEEREIKEGPSKPDPKLYAICRELQRLIQDDVAIAPTKQDDWTPKLEHDRIANYGEWLKGALHDFGLKPEESCKPEEFKKLLEQYKKFFGWDLTSAQIDTWTKKMQGTSSTIGEQQIRAFVEGRAGWLCDVPSDPISQEALLKLADADDWYADMRTGDPDADKLLLRVHTAQRLRDLSFSEANDALRRAFMKNDSRLTEHVSREDFRAALASCRVAEALDSLDVNTRNGALKFFSDSTSFSGANNVNYGLFLKTLRRAWLTRPPPGASGSMTGSRKLDAQLAIVKKKLRESATKQLKDKSALMPLTVFRRLDTNGDGRIEPKEFHEGLTQLGINVDMPLEDIKKLIAFFDDDEDGTMDAYEFLEFVLKGTVGYKAGGSGRRGFAAPEGKSRATPGVPAIGGERDDDAYLLDEDDPLDYDDAFTAARGAIRRKWHNPEDLERLREYLRRKDFASDGTLKERVFLRFLRSSRIAGELSDAQIAKLIAALDTKGDHWINYRLFIRRVIDRAADELEAKSRGAAPIGNSTLGQSDHGRFTSDRYAYEGGRTKRHGGDITEVLAKVNDCVSLAAQRGAPFHSLFSAVDTTGRGLCTRDAFVYVLRAVLGCSLSDQDIGALIDKVKNERAGVSGADSHLVDYNELYNLLVNTTPGVNQVRFGGGTTPMPPHMTPGRIGGRNDPMGAGMTPWGGGGLGMPSVGLGGSVMGGMGGFTPGGMPGMGMAGMGMAGMPGMGMGGFGAMPAPGLDAIGAGASEAVVQEIARRVRALSRAQRTQWGGSWSLERVFEMYDIGRRGAIGAAEFQAALNGIGLVLSGQELAPLLRRFDKLGNGTLVDYRDFCRFVEMDSSDLAFVTTAIAEKLDEQARQGLDVRMAFDLADPSGSGFVSAREFREALRQLSLPLTELQTQALISRFAQVGNPDLVSYDEFLKHAQAAAPTASRGYYRDRDSHVDGAGYDGWRTERGGRRGAHSVWSHSRAWYEREASPKQRREFDDVYSALKTYKQEHDIERSEIARTDRELHGGIGGRSFVDDIDEDASMLRPPRADTIGRPHRLRWDDDDNARGPPSRPSSRNSTPRSPRFDSDLRDGLGSFVDQTGSAPTSPQQAGAQMWGNRTPLSKKGDLPQSTRSAAEARGMWVCAVCYYTENKVGSSKCFICQARNPEARDSMVVSECPNCSFLNSEFSTSCEMCGTKLHGAKLPPSSSDRGGSRRPGSSESQWRPGEANSDDGFDR